MFYNEICFVFDRFFDSDRGFDDVLYDFFFFFLGGGGGACIKLSRHYIYEAEKHILTSLERHPTVLRIKTYQLQFNSSQNKT